jgi:hypothetical protein
VLAGDAARAAANEDTRDAECQCDRIASVHSLSSPFPLACGKPVLGVEDVECRVLATGLVTVIVADAKGPRPEGGSGGSESQAVGSLPFSFTCRFHAGLDTSGTAEVGPSGWRYAS